MDPKIKEKLQQVPAGTIFLFFATMLVVGFTRRGYMLALWAIGWIAFILFKIAFAVKARVEERQRQKSPS